MDYPPMQSLLNVLLERTVKICFVGYCSDSTTQSKYAEKGVEFVEIYNPVEDRYKSRIANHFSILYRDYLYSKKISRFLSDNVSSDDIVWVEYSDSAHFLHKALGSYRYVIQFYEFVDVKPNAKKSMFCRSFDASEFLNNAAAVVHCEYIRALIMNGLYNVKAKTFVLPNKPFLSDESSSMDIPNDIAAIVDKVKEKIEGKKVILYQGIFESNERRLEEFCESMQLLSDDFIFIVMGGRGGYFEEIKKKYVSDKILYIPFIKPPFHLLITQLANVGVLTYFPVNRSYVGVLNPLFCAPNKIFEYSKYSIPMIANEVPGLNCIFEQYNCGRIVKAPISAEAVANCIKEIFNNYETLARGASDYYNSIDLKNIINEILHGVGFEG